MNAREADGALTDLGRLLEAILDRLDDVEEKIEGGTGYSLEERIEALENNETEVTHDELNSLHNDLQALEARVDDLEG